MKFFVMKDRIINLSEIICLERKDRQFLKTVYNSQILKDVSIEFEENILILSGGVVIELSYTEYCDIRQALEEFNKEN